MHTRACLSLVVLLASCAGAGAEPHHYSAGAIEIDAPWTKATSIECA